MNEYSESQRARKELYEKLWSAPTTKVAAELGISDVALSKRCKKLNVPKPPLGYWAKVAAGQSPPKTPLPVESAPPKFEPLKVPVPKELPINPVEDLHPVASELLKVLRAGTPDSSKRVKAETRDLPRVTVSLESAEKAAKVLHVILTGVETRGIPFRKSRSKYEGAYFEKDSDRMNLVIEEATTPRDATTAEKRQYGQWQQFSEPSGKLKVTINPDLYGGRTERSWTETEKLSLEGVVAQVVQAICKHYDDLVKKHAQEAEESRKRMAAYKLEREAEEKQQHATTLTTTANTREEDLVKAAEWWRIHQTTVAFIDACEQRWRGNQSGEITSEQQTWLEWARANADTMSPFETGYPDPAKDGPFDPASVQFGGPYPSKRNFPRPPTIPKIPPPVQQSSYGNTHTPPPERYPFWLKNRGR